MKSIHLSQKDYFDGKIKLIINCRKILWCSRQNQGEGAISKSYIRTTCCFPGCESFGIVIE